MQETLNRGLFSLHFCYSNSWVCHITEKLSSLEYQFCNSKDLKEVQGNLGKPDSAPNFRPPATSINTPWGIACNHLQSSAIRLHQPEWFPLKKIPCGSISTHFGSCALPSLFNFHKVPLNCGACDCGTVVATPRR